jgi:hypothetical protein
VFAAKTVELPANRWNTHLEPVNVAIEEFEKWRTTGWEHLTPVS